MIKTINVHDLKQQLDKNPKLLLIDVREQDEWHAIHIEFARHIPKSALIDTIRAEALPEDAIIYLHCRSGVRSENAAKELYALGYNEVCSVEGGILAWESQGYPCVYDAKQG